jgi:hypothetical protein
MNILVLDKTGTTLNVVEPWLFLLALLVSMLLILAVARFSSRLASRLGWLTDKGRSHSRGSHSGE